LGETAKNLRDEIQSPEFKIDFGGEPTPEDDARRERIFEILNRTLSSGLITREDVVCTTKAAITLEAAEFKRRSVCEFLKRYSQRLCLRDTGGVEDELVERAALSSDPGLIEYYGESNLLAVPNEGVGAVESFVRKFVSGLLPSTGTPTYTSVVAHLMHMCMFSDADFAEIPPEEFLKSYFGELPENVMDVLAAANPDEPIVWELGPVWFKLYKRTSHMTCFYVMVAKQWAVAFFLGYAQVIAPFVERANGEQRRRFGPKKTVMELCYASSLAVPHIIGTGGTKTIENNLQQFLVRLSDQGETTITRSDVWFETVRRDIRCPVRIGFCKELNDIQRMMVQDYVNLNSGNTDDYDDDLPW